LDHLRISAFGRSLVHDVAVNKGFYAAEGLEVDQDVTQASKAQMQDLIDGTTQLVSTNADNIAWWVEDNGADFVIVAATPSPANQNLVVRPEIKGYADVRGKVLAADAARSGYTTPLRVLLKENGIVQEGTDFTFVEVGSTEHRVEALRSGQAVGAMLSAGAERSLGEGFQVLDNINRLYQHPVGISAVRRSWVENKADVLVRYLRATLRAHQWTRDPANTTELAALSGRPASGGQATRGKPEPFSWEGLREMLEMRQSVGLLRGAPDPARFADDSFYNEAVASL
jgi:ABC-type nitrate/sulfonate/bicarbonate transport system substrate-binding protein